jgi:hypothetical protein
VLGKELPVPLPPPQAESAEAAIKETRARRAIADVETWITRPPANDSFVAGVYRMISVFEQ